MQYDYTHDTMKGLESDGLVRINKGGSGDFVWTINNSTILNITGAFQRFNEGNVNALQTSFKPSDVGLPAYMDAKAGDLHELPQISFSGGINAIGGGVNTGNFPTVGIRGSTATLKGALTKIHGKHSFNMGWDERRYWTTTAGPAYTSGRFNFTNSFTRSADNDSTASNWALSWAAFMMGLPSSMTVDTNDSGLWSVPWHGGWVQDKDKSGTNVRSASSPNAKIVKVFPFPKEDGEQVIVNTIGYDSGWLKIRFAETVDGTQLLDRVAWISGKMVTASVETKNSKPAMLYAAATRNSRKVGTIPNETLIAIVGFDCFGFKVSYKGKTGWLSSEDTCGNPVTTCP
jgi:hypothetical protein